MKPTTAQARRNLAPTLFAPLLAGMLTAQAIATGFVYHSNHRLYALVAAMKQAGYFPIPTGAASETLNTFAAAFWGGLFFTLSIGAGLALVSWAAIRVWILLFHRNRSVLVICVVLWAAGVAGVNLDGLALYPSLFFLLVPLITAAVAIAGAGAGGDPQGFSWMVPVATLIALTGLWATQLNQDLFIGIRDQVLLSNPLGRSINDFYYRYTLYAAEAFKSFQQKSIRSCRLEGGDNTLTSQWEARLAALDVLVLPELGRPDIRMIFSPQKVRMVSPGGRRLEMTTAQFLADPHKWIRAYSQATDRFAPLRRMTLVGLLLGFPVLLFVTVHGGLQLAAGLIMNPRQATLSASGACLLIGIALFMPMLNARPAAMAADDIPAALNAGQWPQRVAALRYIEQHKLEITHYPEYRRLLTSPLVVERYWLARAMAPSRSDETYDQLLALMNDPHPNVVCQAFYALGQRGRPSAVAAIKKRMIALNHWYAQWYGYGALRKLGWRQTRSN
jgi:HEAT repeats